MMTAKRRRLLPRIALAVASLVASLVAAEIGLRLFHLTRIAKAGDLRQQLERSRRTALEEAGGRGHFDIRGLVQASTVPDIVYELKPRLDGEFKGGRVQTNTWGFRGPEVELDKPRGTFRIVGLGDSMMFGWGVHQEDIYAARLERALNALGETRYEFLNLAVPGYNTVMEVESLASKGLLFDPDLVLVHFFSNDLSLPFFMQHPRNYVASTTSFYLGNLVRSAMGWEPAPDMSQRVLLRRDLLQNYWEDPDEVRGGHVHMTGEAAVLQALARLAKLAGERSIPVVLMIWDIEPAMVDLARRAAQANGMYFLETKPRFLSYLRQNGKTEDQWSDTFWNASHDQHPNALGHSLLADTLLEFLLANDLVRR